MTPAEFRRAIERTHQEVAAMTDTADEALKVLMAVIGIVLSDTDDPSERSRRFQVTMGYVTDLKRGYLSGFERKGEY